MIILVIAACIYNIIVIQLRIVQTGAVFGNHAQLAHLSLFSFSIVEKDYGCKSIVWRCISRLEPISATKSCTNRTVNELLLQEITVKTINQILTERDFFLKTLQQNIAKTVGGADTLSPDGIQARLEELQKELIKKADNKQDYDAIADEIFRLRDQKEKSELDSHHQEEAMNRIKELQNFIAGQETDITEFDEALVKKLIEKITVFADHFTVEFKSGITIDIGA